MKYGSFENMTCLVTDIFQNPSKDSLKTCSVHHRKPRNPECVHTPRAGEGLINISEISQRTQNKHKDISLSEYRCMTTY